SLHELIFWSRALVLLFSVCIIFITLGLYNHVSTPIFTIINNEDLLAYDIQDKTHSPWLIEMIQDRRLIATLVATHASIFCPLFLLLGCNLQANASSSVAISHVFRAPVELICQLIMPLGLAMSWILCMKFDQKTAIVLSVDQHWL
ncbi:hypothetical protein BDF14DRAFT_1697801, partial [Spinellus fusiger]